MSFDLSFFGSLVQVILIDLVLAGDNAVVIGLAAAGLALEMRRKAVLIGIVAATVLRIIFALITTQLLLLGGALLVVGGLLLLYVCWKMYRELHESGTEASGEGTSVRTKAKTLPQAVLQIIIADVSMSLDNVLAVAGAAQHHIEALVFGLFLSVVLMGVAASFIATLLARYRWITWIGLAVIVYVAIRMLYSGIDQVLDGTLPVIPLINR